MRRLNRKKSEIRELHLQLISTKNEVERLRVWIRKFKISEPSFLDRYVLQCVSNIERGTAGAVADLSARGVFPPSGAVSPVPRESGSSGEGVCARVC